MLYTTFFPGNLKQDHLRTRSSTAFLLDSAAVAGLLSAEGHTLAMRVDAFSMIVPPLTVKAGNRLASRLRAMPASAETAPANILDRHVVILGYEEVGHLIDLMLEKANIPHVDFDRNITVVRQGKRSGRNVRYWIFRMGHNRAY